MVRNLPDELVRALKQRAAKRNRSAEQEHREILKAALKGPGQWLLRVSSAYADRILPLDEETGHIWGCLRVPNPKHSLDKQIAATALIHDLEVISGNVTHYAPTGVRVRNPFT